MDIDTKHVNTADVQSVGDLSGKAQPVFKAPKYKNGRLRVIDSISTRPVGRSEPDWILLQDSLAERAKKGGVDTLFLGDSITYGMRQDILKKNFGPGALNLGIGGDRTQHLLWRMQNGELNFPRGQHPKVVVMLIGTNNFGSYLDVPPSSNREIIEGIKANVNELRTRLPDTKILVVGILPRGETLADPLRPRIVKINKEVAQISDNQNVFFIDVGSKFLQPNGNIARDVMHDFLHPTNQKGNEILLGSIKPYVDKIK